MSDTEPTLVERLLDEFVERLRRGETPSIAQYEAAHPQCAAQIRELFPTILAMEQLARRRQQELGSPAVATAVPQRLGDYQIVREIGRGGMGIVYEAEQESLLRRVAVKVLPRSALLNPQALQRFQREAQTAARLHHSNIVPVFGVGEDRGLHYIVMQLIQGVGLDRLLGELVMAKSTSTSVTRPPSSTRPAHSVAWPAAGASSPPARRTPARPPVATTQGPTAASLLGVGARFWQNAARIGAQAARALQYAHERGTLHRDVKPGNLLLDAQGVVWISDFGLAKAIEHDDVSQAGEIVGTLRYMAPERFGGAEDARSDIYSLGLSLYELLTLRPAFEQSHPSELMQRITRAEPVRPRAINADVPRDLETIVLKAIACEPRHRYASAGELAEDLERFLADRPIRARRVSPVEQLWRWARRNRALASLAGTTAALLLLVAVVASVGYFRTELANRHVRESLAKESHQRQRVEALTELTLEALDGIFEQFVPSQISRTSELAFDDAAGRKIRVPVQPVLSKEAAVLLERMLTFYDRLAGQDTTDTALLRKVADANRRVGVIRRRLGHLEQARTAYLRAIEKYRQLEQVSPGDSAMAVEIARIYNELGDLGWTARWAGDGREFHLQALAILQAAAPTTPAASPQSRFPLAQTYYYLGRGAPPDSQSPGWRPRPKPDGTDDVGGEPDSDPPRDAGPSPFDRTSTENEKYLQQAIQLLERLLEDASSAAEYRHLLACCYRDLPSGRADSVQALPFEAADKAVAILRQLVDDFPKVAEYRHDLSKTYAKFEPPKRTLAGGYYRAAEQRLREALRISEELVAEHPNMPDFAAEQVQILYTLSEVLRRTRRPEDVEATLRKALALQTALVERFPKALPYKSWKAILQDSLAKLLAEDGRAQEAWTILESAVAALEEVSKTEPQAVYVQSALGRCYQNLADVLTDLGEAQAADEMLRRGRSLQPNQ